MNTKKIRTLTSLFPILLLIFGLSACDRASQVVRPAKPDMMKPTGKITIGVVLPLTGRLTESFGIPMQQGLELARTEIKKKNRHGPTFEFITEDDKSTVEGAVAAFNTLIHKKNVSVILGPATSTQTEAAFQVAQESHVVAISPVSAARGLSAIGDFVFRVSLTTDILTPTGIQTTQEALGYQRVATLYDEADLFSTDGNQAIREILADTGVEVLTTETFVGGELDFSEPLNRIKALNPDAVFVSASAPERPHILLQRHELGLSVPFFLPTLTGIDVGALGDAAEGAISFVGWSSTGEAPKNRTFVQNYNTKYGVDPNNYAASSYASLYILSEAIATADATDSTTIRDALANIHGLDTIFGPFAFDENGDAVYEPKVVIVREGELVLFE